MEVKIEESNLKVVLRVLRVLPEFDQMLQDDFYLEKVGKKESLMLIATKGHEIVGCKAGYNRYGDGSFYSWLGGVLPDHRNEGIATILADYQENWAKAHGYTSIKFKTLNKHRNMLLFSIRNGFSINGLKEKDEIENYKIRLIKQLI